MPDFFAEFSIIEADATIADMAGRIGAMLLDVGKQIGMPDLLIAATAITNDLTVVTRNTRHFGLIPALRCCDWLAD
jgi:tRNA(fMet)-specific endonuclease VapC